MVRTTAALLLALLVAHLVLADRRLPADEDCPMCDYVYDNDNSYEYRFDSSFDRSEDLGIPVTTHFLIMTSQQWLDDSWSDRPVWEHIVAINVPNELANTEHAVLYVSHGSNYDSPDKNEGQTVMTARMANNLQIPTGVVYQIPNQPITLVEDPTQAERWEDNFLAWTESYFLAQEAANSPADPVMLGKFAMVKGSVRALDTIQSYVNDDLGLAQISKFFVSGQSKRGYATWMTGVMDDRVIGVAPTVLTGLNVDPTWHHYYPSFGGWPTWWWDYWKMGLCGVWLDAPELPVILNAADPYTYREWMTYPKLIIAGSSDEFFLLDDSHYYFDDLAGEKFMWLVEDAGHGIAYSPSRLDYWDTIETFFWQIMNEHARPVITWTADSPADREGVASLTITTDQIPINVTAYSAMSVVPGRRDWRLIMVCDDNEGCDTKPTDIKWEAKEAEEVSEGNYYVEYEVPADGFLAFFVKMYFSTPDDSRNLIVSTEAVVAPDYFPFPDCYGRNCTGELV